MISFLSQNAWLLTMGVIILMVERFQKNNRWIKKDETSPPEINPTLIMSWFVSYNFGGVLTGSLVEVTLILFDGERSVCWFLMSPHSVALPRLIFISKLTDLLTPSFLSALKRLQDQAWLLLHQWRAETSERSMRCLAFWFHPQLTKNSCWAPLALPGESKTDDLTLTCAPRMQ